MTEDEKMDDADTVEDEANEQEVQRIRHRRLGKAGLQFQKSLVEFKKRYEVDEPSQPAPQPDGEWRYVETVAAAEIAVGQFTLRAHWTGLADGNEVRALMAQIVADYDAQQQLLAALESEDFYNLMQTYRLAPVSNQDVVIAAFEAVKAFIRAAGREEG